MDKDDDDEGQEESSSGEDEKSKGKKPEVRTSYDIYAKQRLGLRERDIPRVTHLDLSRNDVGDAGLTKVAQWLETGCLAGTVPAAAPVE